MYVLDDLVAIQREQKEKGAKFRPSFLGPYKVTTVLRNDRYVVQKMEFGG